MTKAKKPVRGLKPMTMKEFERTGVDKKKDKEELAKINAKRSGGGK